jgi:hypothetical protein
MGWFWTSKKNTRFTSKETIVNQMTEMRPLPIGRKQFEEWSERIISGALLEGVTIETQKWTLANLLMHCGPTESHKPDAFFIHSLRKNAVNETAIAMREEIKRIHDERVKKEKEAPVLVLATSNPDTTNEKAQVLADGKVQGT